MCGIAGLLNVDGQPADPRVVAAMRDALAHRGPDDEGLHVDREVGLGHRRLSIIDLSRAANQPMFSPDGRIAIVFNGEIYNFRELRRDLERLGWAFRTRSDTEVLIAGYAIWGIRDLARRIDGMAAFALWDAGERRLHLVRDRFGVKPLYLWRRGASLMFASEIKAFLAHPDFSVRVNDSALREYFHFPEPLSRAHPVRRRRATAAGDHPVGRRRRRTARDLLGLRLLTPRTRRSRSRRRNAGTADGRGGRAPTRLRRSGRRLFVGGHQIRARSSRSPPAPCRDCRLSPPASSFPRSMESKRLSMSAAAPN